MLHLLVTPQRRLSTEEGHLEPAAKTTASAEPFAAKSSGIADVDQATVRNTILHEGNLALGVRGYGMSCDSPNSRLDGKSRR